MRAVPLVLCLLAGVLAIPAAEAHAGTYAGRVRWAASAGEGVRGYRVYVRASDGVYGEGIDVGMPAPDGVGTLSAIVNDLDVRTDYRFSVTAVGDGGEESERSNEIAVGYVDVAGLLDSDGDGLVDAAEDRNLNRVVDVGETDPQRFDTDADGVGDADDACPDTPANEAVGASGCSCAQVVCDDGDPCNGEETCVAGSCQPGAPLLCVDADACTDDSCVPGLGCRHVLRDGCLSCNGPADCPAPDACSIGVCQEGRCASVAAPDGAACGDGDPCNGDEVCASGVCRSGPPLSCDDGNACTTDSCDANGGGCRHVASPGCQACAADSQCDDGDPCTTDVCALGRCGHVEVQDGSCGGGAARALLMSEVADRSGAIPLDGATAPAGDMYVFVDPEDGIHHVEFHVDDPDLLRAPHQIENKPPYDLEGGSPTAANPFDALGLAVGEHSVAALVYRADGATEVLTAAFHVGEDVCAAQMCDDDNPCTVDTCVAGVGCSHVPVVDGSACDNGDPCDGTEVCLSGSCMAGAPLACDDGNACTVDRCNAPQGCVHEPLAGCRACATDLQCDDGNPCTRDGCNGGRCAYTPADTCGAEHPYGLMLSFSSDRSDAVPLDGEAVRGDMWVFLSPTAGVDRVRFYVDDAERRRKAHQTENNPPFDLEGGSVEAARAFDAAALGEGQHVITAEVKELGGTVVVVSAAFSVEGPLCTGDADCDDGNPCTENTCDPQAGCVTARLPDASPCSDGVFCNGLETCWNTICRAGPVPDCDDGNVCTSDACDESAGRCAHDGIDGCCTSDADCTDNDLCTMAERCENRRCASDPVPCPDAGACHETTCNPAFGCRTDVVADGTACEAVDSCASTGTCVGGSCEASDGERLDDPDLRLTVHPRGKRLVGRAVLPRGLSPDPTTSGLEIELVDTSGSSLYRAQVPGAAFSANRARSVFKYTGRRGAGQAAGLRRLVVKYRRGRMTIAVKLAGGSLAPLVDAVQFTWMVRAGSACASAAELRCLAKSTSVSVCQ